MEIFDQKKLLKSIRQFYQENFRKLTSAEIQKMEKKPFMYLCKPRK